MFRACSSNTMCHMFFFFIYFLFYFFFMSDSLNKLGKGVDLVAGGSVINGAYPVYFGQLKIK